MSQICAECGETIERREICPSCSSPTALEGRYRLLEILGEGGMGTTYKAERIADGAVVAVKEMLVRRAESLKTLTLFEREAGILKQLDHPGIPTYYEDFNHGVGKQIGLYLVQEHIAGHTLLEEQERKRHTEKELLSIIAELLDIVAYLHSLVPPVIHRDIKPANIMRRSDTGSLVLLDFGAVRDVLKDRAAGGSTVAGTFGYMAPEQFRGEASRASDLYAVGVTLVALATRQSPQELLGHDQRLAWEEAVEVSTPVRGLIEKLLQLEPDKRPQSAGELAKKIRAFVSGATATIVDAPLAVPLRPQPTANPLQAIAQKRGGIVGNVLGQIGDHIAARTSTAMVSHEPREGALTAPPPEAPRTLPKGYSLQDPGSLVFMIVGGFMTVLGMFIGGVFTTIGFAVGFTAFKLVGPGIMVLLGGIGLTIFLVAFRKRLRKKKVYTQGAVALATLTEVGKNYSISINNRRPDQATYVFEVDGQRYTGSYSSIKQRLTQIFVPGEQLYVLYDNQDPRENVLYLPNA